MAVKASMVFFNRGNIELKKQNYSEAIENFSKAIELNSKDIQGYMLRAEAYLQIKEYELSIDDLFQVLKISPKSSVASCKIADIYKQQNNFDQAQYYYKNAIEFNPRNPFAYFGYAQLCEIHNKKDLALENYKKTSEIDVKLSKECNLKISQLK